MSNGTHRDKLGRGGFQEMGEIAVVVAEPFFVLLLHVGAHDGRGVRLHDRRMDSAGRVTAADGRVGVHQRGMRADGRGDGADGGLRVERGAHLGGERLAPAGLAGLVVETFHDVHLGDHCNFTSHCFCSLCLSFFQQQKKKRSGVRFSANLKC